MSTTKKRATGVTLVILLLSLAVAFAVAMGGTAVKAADSPDYITTTFANDMGRWVSDPGSTASTEIMFDEAEGGYLKMNLTGGSPTIVLDNIALDTSLYKAMAFRVKYDLQDPDKMAHPSLGNHFSIYIASESVAFGSALWWPNITEQVKADGWVNIIVDFTDGNIIHPSYPGSKWEGTINKFRLDPIWSEGQAWTKGDSISIDFVKFYADKAAAEDEINAGYQDDATVNAKGSENFFNFTKSAQDWTMANMNPSNSGWQGSGDLKASLAGEGLYAANDPQFNREWKIGVSLDEYKYLAVKMKNGTSDTQSKIYYMRDSEGPDESRAATAAITANADDYQIAVFDMSAVSNWNGVPKKIRFDIVEGAAESGEVLVDWIGFYKSQDEIPELDWEDDDRTLPEGPVVEFPFTSSAEGWLGNDDAVLSNEFNALKITVDESKNDPNITYKFENGLKTSTYPVMQIKMRNQTAGETMEIYFAGKDEVIDGSKIITHTITANDRTHQIYTLNLGATGAWLNSDVYTLRIDPTNAGGGNVLIDYIRFYRSMDEAEANGLYEDDSVARPNSHTEFNFSLYNSYWTNASSSNGDVSCLGGNMVVDVKGESPAVEYNYEHGDYSDWAEGVDAKTYNYLVIKMKVSSARSDVTGSLMFKRNLSGEQFSADRAFTFNVTPGAWQKIIIDLSKNHYWNSTVSGLRLLPVLEGVSGEKAEIDYIKFYKTTADITVDGDYNDDPTGDAKTYFDFREMENRFDAARETHGKAEITDGGMVTTITDKDPVLMYSYVYDGVGLNADEYKYMKICFKNESSSTMWEFMWDAMDSDGNISNWGASSNVSIETMSANDTDFKEYFIDFSKKEDWKGTILRLRYDPAGWIDEEGSGKVTTRYIKFYKTMEEALSDDPWGSDNPDNPDKPDNPDDSDDSDGVTFTEWKTSPVAVTGLIIGIVGFTTGAVGVVLLVLKKKSGGGNEN